MPVAGSMTGVLVMPISGVIAPVFTSELGMVVTPAAGLMKLIVNAGTDRILGAAILSSEGGELVQILGTLMLAGAPYTVLKSAVYIHPTLAEGFFGLMESVKPVPELP